MTKIKLSIENLRVESFTTLDTEGGHGTVFGRANTIDFCLVASGQDAAECGSARETGCIPGCETWYGMGICSAHDGCASAPHGWTPCAGCVGTERCVIYDGGVLG